MIISGSYIAKVRKSALTWLAIVPETLFKHDLKAIELLCHSVLIDLSYNEAMWIDSGHRLIETRAWLSASITGRMHNWLHTSLIFTDSPMNWDREVTFIVHQLENYNWLHIGLIFNDVMIIWKRSRSVTFNSHHDRWNDLDLINWMHIYKWLQAQQFNSVHWLSHQL